jgi:hypothetical protein
MKNNGYTKNSQSLKGKSMKKNAKTKRSKKKKN